MSNTSDIMIPLRVATMLPLDAKSIVQTLDELKDLGENNQKAMTYYEGMPVYCVENETMYRWKKIGFGSNGLLSSNFVYPPSTVVNGKDYSGQLFNFVVDSSGGSSGNANMFFTEPSVNIEIKDDPLEIEEAMHFGTMDIGQGEEDLLLVKNTFVPQSQYDIKLNRTIGDHIKLYSSTTNIYLGHFVKTDRSYNGYMVFIAIEKGDWSKQEVFNTQKILIHILKESLYSLSLSGSTVRIQKGPEIVGQVDLSAIVSAGGAVTIVSGVLNPANGIVTFTLSDASTFDVDFSALLTAEDLLSKEGVLAVKGKDIYENIFVTKAGMGFFHNGYYAADITTNYNATSIQGFPFPANIKNVLVKYQNNYFLLIKKDADISDRVFFERNNVISLSWFKFKSPEKSMAHLGHFNILSGVMELPGLNSNWNAFKVWIDQTSGIDLSESSGSFDETELIEGINEQQAKCFFTTLYKEFIPLKKTVAAPYTLKNEDLGRILHFTNGGTVTVPNNLKYGFHCGFRKASSTVNNLNFQAGSGVSLQFPSGKEDFIIVQNGTAYLECNEEYSPTALNVPATSTNYIISGDFENL